MDLRMRNLHERLPAPGGRAGSRTSSTNSPGSSTVEPARRGAEELLRAEDSSGRLDRGAQRDEHRRQVGRADGHAAAVEAAIGLVLDLVPGQAGRVLRVDDRLPRPGCTSPASRAGCCSRKAVLKRVEGRGHAAGCRRRGGSLAQVRDDRPGRPAAGRHSGDDRGGPADHVAAGEDAGKQRSPGSPRRPAARQFPGASSPSASMPARSALWPMARNT